MKTVRAKYRLALITWLAVYPIMTAVLYLLERSIADWPLALRTLLVCSIMVPVTVFWAMPAATAFFRGFLNPDTSGSYRAGDMDENFHSDAGGHVSTLPIDTKSRRFP